MTVSRSLHLMCILLLIVLALPGRAQLAWDDKAFMPVSEIKEGMIGYGKTVLQGTRIITFPIKVLGVLKNYDMEEDIILIQVTSGQLVKGQYGLVQGMSGSPIYINNRLIGAYSLGFMGSLDFIGGVTPIASMLETVQPGSTGRLSPHNILTPREGVVSTGHQTFTEVQIASTMEEARQLEQKTDNSTMVLTPLATPLFASGMSSDAISALQKQVSPMNMTVLPGAGNVDPKLVSKKVKLEPGAMVGTALFDGDISVYAMGTVTYVKGNTVLAFGHAFNNFGKSSYPMATAYVHTTLRNRNASFKIASPVERIGAVVKDGPHAIGGIIGAKPDMVPVDVTVRNTATEVTKSYHVDVFNHPNYSAYYLFLMGIINPLKYVEVGFTGNVQQEPKGKYTARFRYVTDKFGTLEQRVVASRYNEGTLLPLVECWAMLNLLYENTEQSVKLEHFIAEVDYTPEAPMARIESVTPDRLVARPGDTIKLIVKMTVLNGKPIYKTLFTTIPSTTNSATVVVGVVGGAESGLMQEFNRPKNTTRENMLGFIRSFSGDLSFTGLVQVAMYPTPATAFLGQEIRDLPRPLLELLRFQELGTSNIPYGAVNSRYVTRLFYRHSDFLNPFMHASIYCNNIADETLISGAALAVVQIDNGTDKAGIYEFNYPTPIVSLDSGPSGLSYGLQPPTKTSSSAFSNYLDYMPNVPGAQQQLDAIYSLLQLDHVSLPTLALPGVKEDLPLYLPLSQTMDAQPKSPVPPPPVINVLSTKPITWGMEEMKDFLHGQYIGTVATTMGKITLAPMARSLFQADVNLQPWKIIRISDTVYMGGWGSGQLQVIPTVMNGVSTILDIPLPKDTRPSTAVTALAADNNGNLLAATFPNCFISKIEQGTVRQNWKLPADTIVWDLAVTSDGRRFAGCNDGVVYELLDDGHVRASVFCPDKEAYVLVTDGNDNLYIGTMPRGRVYRLAKNGELKACYDASTPGVFAGISSMAVDSDGTIYVGRTPDCTVVRITADGCATNIFTGMGKDNRAVNALQLVGGDLYVGTGIPGGIYRISSPAGIPDIAAIFAREDLRVTDVDKNPFGPESTIITDLAAGVNGEVYVAAAMPGQVLCLVPRTTGIYLTNVFKAPAPATWGRVSVIGESTTDIKLESRSGLTSSPDDTWTNWTPINPVEQQVVSAAASYIQFRLQLQGGKDVHPIVEALRLTYQPINQSPVVKFTEPKSIAYISGVSEVKWEASDPDNDILVDNLFLSADNGKNWIALEQAIEPAKTPEKDAPPVQPKMTLDIANKTYSFDSKIRTDGAYLLKIVTSDKYAKPLDQHSAQALLSVILDNTAPVIYLDNRVIGIDKVQRFDIIDSLSPIAAAAYKIDDGPLISLVPVDGVFDSSRERVLLATPDGPLKLSAGEHQLIIQARDLAGNMNTREIIVVIP